jgi:hypothetical protein
MHVQFLFSTAILARWQRIVASNKALNLPYQAMHAVLYRRTGAAIKMASKVDPFFCRRSVCCCPGSRWGNTEQVVTQWQRPVASRVALDMLHKQCHPYCSIALAWPSKWPAMEVHLFFATPFLA